MARIRTIKPDFWTDEKIGSLKRDERLLFIGLWNLADDQGVVKSNPAYIKGQLFSYDEELRINTVATWLASLTKARLLIPFSHKEEGYFLIRTFHEHQLINRPSKPKFSSQLIQSILENTHGVLTEYSEPEGKGREIEGNGKEGSGETPPGEVFTNVFSDGFLLIWNQWKDYKKTEHKFFYKSVQSEQAAMNELATLAGGNEVTAAAIIHQSMAKGWKGFFHLKNVDDGTTKGTRGRTGTAATGEQLNESFTKFYSQKKSA